MKCLLSRPDREAAIMSKYYDGVEFPFCDEFSKYEKMAKIGQGTFGWEVQRDGAVCSYLCMLTITLLMANVTDISSNDQTMKGFPFKTDATSRIVHQWIEGSISLYIYITWLVSHQATGPCSDFHVPKLEFMQHLYDKGQMWKQQKRLAGSCLPMSFLLTTK